MIRLSDILDRVAAHHPNADLDAINKAYVFSAKMHQGQLRKSGEPYLIHPMEVAAILADMRLDVPSVCTGLLHDAIEDTLATYEEIEQIFGKEVAELVEGVTKISKMHFSTKEERQAENFRKMLMAMARDIRVILVKLGDRLHNMRTLEHLSPEKQKRVAQETLDIYAPLANRLGISWMKSELEDLSLKYLKPEAYEMLVKSVAKRKKERESYIDEVKTILSKKIVEYGIKCEVSGRPKHFYSIWKKMESRDIEFDQIYDLIAFRVLTDNVKECYEVLGIIHSMWKPVLGRFKDFIAMPKANMYQSLHTTVIGPKGERVEIQIRTREMHQIAEYGVAAHWRYKEKNAVIDPKDEQKFGWIRQLLEWQRDVKDPSEFLDTVKLDLFSDEVYVFTPKGDVRAFPHGSTPVDFAYSVHTDVGNHCVGAKVNGRIVPLKYKLRSGDTIEIITAPDRQPSKDWLNFVATSRAKVKIRTFVKQQQRSRGIEFGKDVLERELKRFGVNLNKAVKEGTLQEAGKEHGCQTLDDLYVQISYGKVDLTEIIKKVVPEAKYEEIRAKSAPENGGEPKQENAGAFERLLSRVSSAVGVGKGAQKSPIKISDVEDILVTFGKCCAPIPGDPVIGFITRGRGLTVHAADCARVLASDPERKIEVQWDKTAKTAPRARLKVVCVDQPGLLASITKSMSQLGVNISQAQIRTTSDRRAINTFEVSITDAEHLAKVMKSLETINGVVSVERIRA
ncbi:MAG TPA: bifunctional (p)ppGpp synthetase/guanosine-3',5'-bis(diphosphate) 3'-pyrophosphohydrolase [bacterium]|nr:bifunctional (p)ppGpp synthetase/guanosine-3',5'-bis(diphosphate) 3'-pyrophosphohydrolase [bacterium]